jgi:hypothetical protein
MDGLLDSSLGQKSVMVVYYAWLMTGRIPPWEHSTVLFVVRALVFPLPSTIYIVACLPSTPILMPRMHSLFCYGHSVSGRAGQELELVNKEARASTLGIRTTQM